MPWQALCNPDEIQEGAGREFLVNQQVIAVFVHEDKYFAVDGMCAHQGGPIAQGQQDAQCITCPWHGWQYDLSNGHNLLTHKKMLTTYPIELRDGQLWVEVEAPT